MNLQYKNLLPSDFNADSRTWVYQCNRLFSLTESLVIEDRLNAFVETWQSHGAPVKGFGTLFFGRFIILMADESATGVSGCSTDGSVRLLKQIESDFNVQLFDRQLLAFVIKDKIELIPLAQAAYAAENGFINNESLYFNNTVQTKAELESKWIIPVSASWLGKRIPLKDQVGS
jgi:hypothetical protein